MPDSRVAPCSPLPVSGTCRCVLSTAHLLTPMPHQAACKFRANRRDLWNDGRGQLARFLLAYPEGSRCMAASGEVRRLSLTLEMAMAPRLGLEVSPALIAFSEMLPLPLVAMQSVVEDELGANAALERLDAEDCPICRSAWRARCPVCSALVRPGTRQPVSPTLPDGGGDRAGHACPAPGRAPGDQRRRLADRRVPHRQPRRARPPGSAAGAARRRARRRRVDRPACALEVIRGSGPPGIGATNVAECLLLQMDALGLADDRARLARAVIAEHLPALARGHFSSIAAALGVTRAQVQKVLEATPPAAAALPGVRRQRAGGHLLRRPGPWSCARARSRPAPSPSSWWSPPCCG